MSWTPEQQALLNEIEAVAALCRAGFHERPVDTQGGFNVAWMRRQLLGRFDHGRVRDRGLERAMAVVGFRRRSEDSIVFDLEGQGAKNGQGR